MAAGLATLRDHEVVAGLLEQLRFRNARGGSADDYAARADGVYAVFRQAAEMGREDSRPDLLDRRDLRVELGSEWRAHRLRRGEAELRVVLRDGVERRSL